MSLTQQCPPAQNATSVLSITPVQRVERVNAATSHSTDSFDAVMSVRQTSALIAQSVALEMEKARRKMDSSATITFVPIVSTMRLTKIGAVRNVRKSCRRRPAAKKLRAPQQHPMAHSTPPHLTVSEMPRSETRNSILTCEYCGCEKRSDKMDAHKLAKHADAILMASGDSSSDDESRVSRPLVGGGHAMTSDELLAAAKQAKLAEKAAAKKALEASKACRKCGNTDCTGTINTCPIVREENAVKKCAGWIKSFVVASPDSVITTAALDARFEDALKDYLAEQRITVHDLRRAMESAGHRASSGKRDASGKWGPPGYHGLALR